VTGVAKILSKYRKKNFTV